MTLKKDKSLINKRGTNTKVLMARIGTGWLKT